MLEPESKCANSVESVTPDFAGNSADSKPSTPPTPADFGSEVVQDPPFSETSLMGFFHANYHYEPVWLVSSRVFDWVSSGWLVHEQFRIPIRKKINRTFGGIRCGDGDAHMQAKASISKWLWKTRRASCDFEVDGIDVVCKKKRIWAECGKTSFPRFEWLMRDRCAELLLVAKPYDGDKTILVHSFKATPAGVAGYAAKEKREIVAAFERVGLMPKGKRSAPGTREVRP